MSRVVLLEDLSEDWLNVVYLLDYEGLTKADCQLKSVQKFGVLLKESFNFIVNLKLLLEPGCGLSVRVYNQWHFFHKGKNLTVLY